MDLKTLMNLTKLLPEEQVNQYIEDHFPKYADASDNLFHKIDVINTLEAIARENGDLDKFFEKKADFGRDFLLHEADRANPDFNIEIHDDPSYNYLFGHGQYANIKFVFDRGDESVAFTFAPEAMSDDDLEHLDEKIYHLHENYPNIFTLVEDGEERAWPIDYELNFKERVYLHPEIVVDKILNDKDMDEVERANRYDALVDEFAEKGIKLPDYDLDHVKYLDTFVEKVNHNHSDRAVSIGIRFMDNDRLITNDMLVDYFNTKALAEQERTNLSQDASLIATSSKNSKGMKALSHSLVNRLVDEYDLGKEGEHPEHVKLLNDIFKNDSYNMFERSKQSYEMAQKEKGPIEIVNERAE